MVNLTIYVTSEGRPVEDKNVFISISSGILPSTHDDSYTDNDGYVTFNVPDYSEVTINIDGDDIRTVGTGGGDKEVTVSI